MQLNLEFNFYWNLRKRYVRNMINNVARIKRGNKEENEEEGRTQTLLPAFKRLNKQSLEKWGNLIIHQLSFFLGLNASVYTLQTQECTQNGFSSLSTLHPKKAGADTQV